MRARIDTATEPPECGIGVHGHHPVRRAQFGEHRPDAGRHGGLADAALAQHADLVVPAQRCPDEGLQFGFAAFGRRRTEIDQAEGGGIYGSAPAPCGTRPTVRLWRGGEVRPRRLRRGEGLRRRWVGTRWVVVGRVAGMRGPWNGSPRPRWWWGGLPIAQEVFTLGRCGASSDVTCGGPVGHIQYRTSTGVLGLVRTGYRIPCPCDGYLR